MLVKIFNVEHGFCALITEPNGNTIMMDCGSTNVPLYGWTPGAHLRAQGINFLNELVVSHADEDHLSGLESLEESGVSIGWIDHNPTLTPDIIRTLKPNTPGLQTESYLSKLSVQNILSTSAGLLRSTPHQHQVDVENFWCIYDRNSSIQNLNDLSLVRFVSYGGLNLIFPGDLEEEGWQALLTHSDFRTRLSNINVFIASHHGRRNGYCAEIFEYFNPEIIIFSDGGIQHDTQKTAGLYGNHARGLTFKNGVPRKVLTTRNNGIITLASTAQAYELKIEKGF